MVFDVIFNSISLKSQQPVHLSMLSWSSFNQCTQHNILLSHITIVQTTESGGRGMNPVAMTIINPAKEYWLSRRLNQRPPILKSATLQTELWGWQIFLILAKIINMCQTSDFPKQKNYTFPK